MCDRTSFCGRRGHPGHRPRVGRTVSIFGRRTRHWMWWRISPGCFIMYLLFSDHQWHVHEIHDGGRHLCGRDSTHLCDPSDDRWNEDDDDYYATSTLDNTYPHLISNIMAMLCCISVSRVNRFEEKNQYMSISSSRVCVDQCRNGVVITRVESCLVNISIGTCEASSAYKVELLK